MGAVTVRLQPFNALRRIDCSESFRNIHGSNLICNRGQLPRYVGRFDVIARAQHQRNVTCVFRGQF